MIDDGVFFGGTRRVRVGCELSYELPYPAPLMFVLEPKDRPSQRILDSRRAFSPILGPERFRSYEDAHGNIIWRVNAPAGRFEVLHDVILQVSASLDPVIPELTGTPIHELPDEVIVYTLPSRYCPSDLFVQDAWNLFGNTPEGWARVQAVCDWLHANITYGAGSNASSTALDAYFSRRGVCRDFAHLGVSFCRALNIPARYVCGYLPDIGVPPDGLPMDFHAWFEVYLGGAWRTFDARHNHPRTGRVIIATGRDAADTAFSTTYGPTQLTMIRVWADEAQPQDHLPKPDEVARLGSRA